MQRGNLISNKLVFSGQADQFRRRLCFLKQHQLSVMQNAIKGFAPVRTLLLIDIPDHNTDSLFRCG
ncbi:Uncharacterised protein [Klebsiella pneumoniae]|nr:Uncharacterised protein [Klebsiella pneumoniae]